MAEDTPKPDPADVAPRVEKHPLRIPAKESDLAVEQPVDPEPPRKGKTKRQSYVKG